MVLFVIANPDVRYPYQEELVKERLSKPFQEIVDSLREILRRRQRPQCTSTYEVQQASKWNNVLHLHRVHRI